MVFVLSERLRACNDDQNQDSRLPLRECMKISPATWRIEVRKGNVILGDSDGNAQNATASVHVSPPQSRSSGSATAKPDSFRA
jgi:hypothetical protein